jgi:diguanylate cyclase (GGDEF)-like protein
MWQKISIRWQLIGLLSIAIILIEISILSLDYWLDVKQRKSMAIEQATTLSHALQHDLIRAALDPQADTYSDISFRISSFDSIVMLQVFQQDIEVFQYVREGFTAPKNLKLSPHSEPVFADRYLHIQQPLKIDNYEFGEIFFLVDLTQYHTGLKEQLINKLLFFKVQFIIALLIAWWISKNYTRPFSVLAKAMKLADVEQASFPPVHTKAENEIGVLYQGYNQLIKEISRTTSDLRYLGEHDSLTGLLNRYAIEVEIENSLKNEQNTRNALLLLDIDEFKLINDTAGHIAGDNLLKQVGQIITTSLYTQGSVARIGGDDFFILLSGSELHENSGIKQAEHLQETFQNYRFTWKDNIFKISICIGVVTFSPCEYTPKSLVIAADTAFYAAKAQGHGQIRVYHADDEKVRQYNSDVQTVAVIKEALHEGDAQFELYAQAIVPLQKQTEKISYEILLRMKDGAGKMVFPDRFLPTANRYQLMIAIDAHVLWKYLETVTAYPEHLKKLAFVNINMGGSTLNHREFQNKVRQAIDRFDFPWHKLVLEVTETSAIGNLAQASDFIQYCRGLGIRVALDDFGTGMASFAYLKHLPFDIVKIDGGFVRDMLNDPIDHTMVRYVHDISKLRGQETIAEFVEEQGHVDALKKIGIDYGQGYFLQRPKPLTEWL